jgi:hypothetical protein
MEGADIPPATLLQSRSPSLDLDSLYGAGPQDPGSAKFYESDGTHLKQGKAQGRPARLGSAAKDVGHGGRGWCVIRKRGCINGVEARLPLSQRVPRGRPGYRSGPRNCGWRPVAVWRAPLANERS